MPLLRNCHMNHMGNEIFPKWEEGNSSLNVVFGTCIKKGLRVAGADALSDTIWVLYVTVGFQQ